MSYFKFLFFSDIAMLPRKIFAHEEMGVPQSKVTLSTYVLIALVLLFLLCLSFYLITKKKIHSLKNAKKKKEEKQQLKKILRRLKWGSILSLIGIVTIGSFSIMEEKLTINDGRTYLEHVHGLGYSTDGKRLIIPSHHGLVTYSDGHWDRAEGENHDYMGFSVAADGFYSSGHPAPGSDKKNPFGIMKSTDEGKNLKMLDLYGEIDFHIMGVGYQSQAIYVINPEPNSRMKFVGLYYSLNETKTWTKSKMRGISEEPTTIAVHPTNKAILALGNQSGVYLSYNYGQNFKKVLSKGQITSLVFSKDGTLFVGGYDHKTYLLKLNVENNRSFEINIPRIAQDDAIAYLAVSSKNEKQIAFTTFKKDIYISYDQASTWLKIAEQGKGISTK
ncbi:F510_1955 family glycosylhydrolase [Bacillus changyiensis]|uniref:F510_1955 family glycosylhydrolase n=1 Tax=Bacillus changyiensis TaxID=3004103 RepID=UPI0022E3327E|nr:glycosyl hydrolase [Bacillus changyiensis]MDA1475171.1 glycosyl hydrolase [Bacillus changyiensis]